MLYKLFVDKSKESSECLLQAWRTDLQDNLTEKEWANACLIAQTQSINTNSKLLQYKWLTRLIHLTLASNVKTKKVAYSIVSGNAHKYFNFGGEC